MIVKKLTVNRPFLWKNSIFCNFGPLGANLAINFFEKLFDFFKPISKGNFW